jgi:hypothetical protein
MRELLAVRQATLGFCVGWPRWGSTKRRLDPSAALRTGAGLREDPQ